MGKHNKYSKKSTGSLKCTLKVSSFTFSIFSICFIFSLYIESESFILFIVYSTSSTVTGLPFDHLLFSSNFIKYVRSFIFEHSSAISGFVLKSCVMFINGSYINFVMCWISRFLVKTGFIVSKFVIPMIISFDITISLFWTWTLFCLILFFM